MELRTERLLLRPARMDDLSGMHAVLSNPVAMRYWSTLPHTEPDQTRAWLDDMIATPADAGLDFIVEHGGRVIGKAGLYRLPEIGYLLHPDFWGRGFAQEALTALITAAFERFAIPAIVADVDPRNAASLRLLQRLGFVETGRAERTFQIGEEWCDSVYLSLARPI